MATTRTLKAMSPAKTQAVARFAAKVKPVAIAVSLRRRCARA
jgi:hypothetical protein